MSLPRGGNKGGRFETTRGRKQSSKKSGEPQEDMNLQINEPEVSGGDDAATTATSAQKDNGPKVSLSFSQSLYKKLVSLASEEGIELEDLVKELVTEGVVNRAWDVAERKYQIRAGQGGQNPRQSGGPNNNRGGGGGHRKGSRMSQQRYQSIMDDKATFLEYVRSQERGNR
ncbi:MAG: hypothetical protein AB7T49_15055 [Oligoflexales bacterium]